MNALIREERDVTGYTICQAADPAGLRETSQRVVRKVVAMETKGGLI